MKNKTLLILLYTLSLLLVICLSAVPGEYRSLLSPLGTLIPLLLGLIILCRRQAGEPLPFGDASRERTALSFALIAPVLCLIILTSALTTAGLSLFGIVRETTVTLSLPKALLVYALIPSLLEEGLYRVLPMIGLGKEGGLHLILFSAITFAMAHLSLFSIPYALVAGLGLILVAMLAKSPLPAFLLHLINNVLGVLMLLYPDGILSYILLGILLAAALISTVVIIKKRVHFREFFREIKENRCNGLFTYDFVCFLALTILLTLINI